MNDEAKYRRVMEQARDEYFKVCNVVVEKKKEIEAFDRRAFDDGLTYKKESSIRNGKFTRKLERR